MFPRYHRQRDGKQIENLASSYYRGEKERTQLIQHENN